MPSTSATIRPSFNTSPSSRTRVWAADQSATFLCSAAEKRAQLPLTPLIKHSRAFWLVKTPHQRRQTSLSSGLTRAIQRKRRAKGTLHDYVVQSFLSPVATARAVSARRVAWVSRVETAARDKNARNRRAASRNAYRKIPDAFLRSMSGCCHGGLVGEASDNFTVTLRKRQTSLYIWRTWVEPDRRQSCQHKHQRSQHNPLSRQWIGLHDSTRIHISPNILSKLEGKPHIDPKVRETDSCALENIIQPTSFVSTCFRQQSGLQTPQHPERHITKSTRTNRRQCFAGAK